MPTGLSHDLTMRPTFTNYSVQVLAVNEEGRGPPSDPVVVPLVDGELIVVDSIKYMHT